MSTETKEVFAILRAIAEELLRLFLEWFRSRPRLASACAVLGVAIGSLVCLKLLFWLLWSPAATPLGSVSGTVTLNSRPLERATIEFTPASGGPSYGITDRRGRYELEYLPGKPGATLGEHVVRITTYDWITGANGTKREIPEVVPERYNKVSTLTTTIRPGSQRVDWALTAP